MISMYGIPNAEKEKNKIYAQGQTKQKQKLNLLQIVQDQGPQRFLSPRTTNHRTVHQNHC